MALASPPLVPESSSDLRPPHRDPVTHSARARRGAILLALLSLGAIVIALDLPLCPMATVTGIPCPGCGLTRATLALVRGDFARAFALHPLSPVLAPLYLGLLASAALSYLRGPRAAPDRSFVSGRLFTALGSVLLVAVFGLWIARFAGAFGGPVPVKTLSAYLTR